MSLADLTHADWRTRAAKLAFETRHFIDGEFADSAKGGRFKVVNPATAQVLCEVSAGDATDIDRAVASARRCFYSRRWSRMAPRDRMAVLTRMAALIEQNAEGFALLDTLCMGKPVRDMLNIDVPSAVQNFAYFGEALDKIDGAVTATAADAFHYILREPLGVVGCIVPWNYPLLLLAWKLAPALAAGNTTVCKPSELTPLSTLALAPLFADFPSGVVNLLAGAGDVGAAIVEDERVDCVAFTGSVATGRRIATRCAERIARVNLELGGKDAFIVCEDVAADIATAAKGGAWAAFLNAGQVCTSAERFYVHRSVYDEFVSEFVAYTESLRLGDPLAATTDIGPMVSAPQRDKVVAQVEAAVAGGAEVVTGGGRGGQATGHFFAPAVVTGAPASTDLLREETFGPVAPIVPVASLDEAVELANGLRFGLGVNVYTRDLGTTVRLLRDLKAGTVWFNDPLTDNDAGPFGGFKQSGLGRELGREGLEAFQETKHVHIESEIAPKEWWYPYGD